MMDVTKLEELIAFERRCNTRMARLASITAELSASPALVPRSVYDELLSILAEEAQDADALGRPEQATAARASAERVRECLILAEPFFAGRIAELD